MSDINANTDGPASAPSDTGIAPAADGLATAPTTTETAKADFTSYANIVLYTLATCTILGFTGRMFWWADYMAHPRMHFAAVLAVLALYYLMRFDWTRVAVATVAVALNLVAITSAVLGTNATANAMTMPPGQLRVITANVGEATPGNPALLQWLVNEHPDIVVLVQANRKWLPALDKLLSALPYQKMADHTTEYGIAILSRFPMDKIEVSVAGPLSLPTLTAEIETPVGRLAVVGVHPNPPGDSEATRARDLYLAQLSAIAQTTSMPTLLAGDFNATPWSSGFETLRMLPNLQPKSIDVPPTWPASFGPVGLPTQHILLSIPYNKQRDIVFSHLGAGPEFAGMSHLPLIADISVR